MPGSSTGLKNTGKGNGKGSWGVTGLFHSQDSKVGFGIAVSGGWDKPNPSSGDPAVIISDVVRGGPAMGRLQTLDHIVMVNGVSMEKATSTYAIQHLKNCGRTANITVKRPRTIQVPVSAPRGVSQNSSRSEDLSLRRDAPSDFDKGYPAPRRGSQGERAPRPPSDLDSGSERSYDRSPSNSAPTRWSPAPDRNGNVLPLMSGYKSLPKYEDPYKPIKAVLVKKDPKEEFGLKLGSQIFVKYMTPTGLASREGTLQEGDIILKINGIVTENLSLEDTKRLVARSASKLSMTVLRDDRQFLVCIPELQDSDVASNASSELEDISDLESELTLPPPQKKDLQDSRGQHSERTRAEPVQAARDFDSASLPRVLPAVMRRPAEGTSLVKASGFSLRVRPQSAHDSDRDSLPRVLPVPLMRPPPDHSDLDSERTPSPPRRDDSLDSREKFNGRLPLAPNGKMLVGVEEDSVGLRLAGGNDVGIFVGGVKPGSLASQQGIEEGDQILKVNGVDFGSFTREEAALYLLQIPKGEQVIIQAQSKLDIYRKMLQSNVGDSFYIRTHFDHEGEGPGTLSFTRGDVFRVLDTMHRGKLGTWRAVRMSNILQEADRGTIPNKSRVEQIGTTFKRPIVILGPLSDVAIQKLSTEMPAEFQTALMVPRNSEEGSSSVIKLETVRQISEQDRHPLLDITPSAVERLNYIQYHPMVLFLDPESRQDVKAMRQQLCPQSNKSSRRLYTQAVKMRKYCPHLFSGKRAFRFDQGWRELPLRSSLIRSWFYSRIPLLPDSNVWFEILKDRIKELQARPVWFSEDKAESGEEEEDLDALSRSRSTDYLSCDSRATSDYEDTDGEACTDNELDEAFEGPALGRSSEPALPQYSEPALARSSEPTWEEEDISHKPYRTHSYSAEPRVWVSAPGADRLTPELEAIDHQAVLWRRPQIRGSMSSEEEEEDKDFDWGPATDL
ncbi:UNVERIFIED_CONTAM: hypothetical protein FKN15_060795 [Acipenser sinensis]